MSRQFISIFIFDVSILSYVKTVVLENCQNKPDLYNLSLGRGRSWTSDSHTSGQAIIVALQHFCFFLSKATGKGIKLMATSLNIHHRKELL